MAERTVTVPKDTEVWPNLPLDAWRETYATLHMWMQIVGKIRLALAPMVCHWWGVTLYVTSRGLTTSPMPYGTRIVQIDFDFSTTPFRSIRRKANAARSHSRHAPWLIFIGRQWLLCTPSASR